MDFVARLPRLVANLSSVPENDNWMPNFSTTYPCRQNIDPHRRLQGFFEAAKTPFASAYAPWTSRDSKA